ncbi:MAG: hypothetical protein ACTSV7_04510 [Candidatus Baldrarchaeia archaeon]
MTFERGVMLALIIALVGGWFWATSKIDGLETALSEKTVDTVTVEIPLTVFDTTYITVSDTVYADADTTVTEDSTGGTTTTIHKYGTYTSSFDTPLVHGSAKVNSRTEQWEWDIKYRSLSLRLEFPDKRDFRKVKVTTIPDVGPVNVVLNEDYKPLKKKRGLAVAIGVGYDYQEEVNLMGDISWKKHSIGITQGKGGRGFYYQYTFFEF